MKFAYENALVRGSAAAFIALRFGHKKCRKIFLKMFLLKQSAQVATRT